MKGTVAQAALLAGALVATALAGVRWLRVAQREHYLTASVLRFARRWWSTAPNRILGAAALIGLVAAAAGIVPAGLVAVAAVAVGPFGLTLRGRTSKLNWTRRLRLLAVTSALLVALLVALAAISGGLALAAATAVLLAVGAPGVVDAALAVTAPVERRLARPYVNQATKKLRSVDPTVVAITGSYGKTTTKGYVAHLLAGSRTVVPTPKSYNNQAGLARAINEQLSAGTEVFVAEMGTYGPGEIAAMCAWVIPDIAVITAIGPVHLERMRSEENVAAAKSEILDGAKIAVLNVDNPLLAGLADRTEAAGTRVWRCSEIDRRTDVCAVEDDGTVRVFLRSPGAGGGSREIAHVQGVLGAGSNVACAVAVALELGVEPEILAARLGRLPTPPNRRQVTTGQSGATIIDDTYNSNPAGCAAALALLARLGAPGEERRRIVVTPGMVELGDRQEDENARFAEAASKVATDIVVVGQTNAAALVAGARLGTAAILRVPTREAAVAWVRGQVGPGDVVLYENDLPDHFP